MTELTPHRFSPQSQSIVHRDELKRDPELCRIVREEASGACQKPTIRRFEKGTELVVQGETPDFLGVLRRGYVRQERLRLDGDHVFFALACPGDIVGGLPWMAATSASEAATDVEICVIDQATIERLMLENPRFRETYLRETQRQYHHLLGSAWRLNALDSRERIMAFLVDATRYMPTEPQPDGSLILTIKVSRRDWADLTNTAVETISRTMRHLAEEELVFSLTSSRFLIRDLDQLALLAGIDPPGPGRDSTQRHNRLFAASKSAGRMTAVNARMTDACRVDTTETFTTASARGQCKRRVHHVKEEIRS